MLTKDPKSFWKDSAQKDPKSSWKNSAQKNPKSSWKMASAFLCPGSKPLKVTETLRERRLLRGGRNGSLDVLHDPLHHVLLFEAGLDVRGFELVVQALLHLGGEGIFYYKVSKIQLKGSHLISEYGIYCSMSAVENVKTTIN